MSFYYRKRIKVFPGVKLNISKSGVSTTIGRKGASVTVGKRGAYINAGIPGSGIYARKKIGRKRDQRFSAIANKNYQTHLSQNTMYKQTYGLPALISFFIPGLGQLIKGDIVKGIAIWIVGGLISFFLWWTIIVPFVIWAWNVYDAYNSDPKA